MPAVAWRLLMADEYPEETSELRRTTYKADDDTKGEAGFFSVIKLALG